MSIRSVPRLWYNLLKTKYPTWSTGCQLPCGYGDLMTYNRIRFISYDNHDTKTFGTCSNLLSNNQVKEHMRDNEVCQDTIDNFMSKINCSLSENNILINALTHHSPVTEELGPSSLHRDRLIFLGHQIMSSCLAEILFIQHPSLTEHQLWDIQNALLRPQFLANCGANLGLDKMIIADVNITNEIITESLFAIVGELYINKSRDFLKSFLKDHIVPELTDEKIKELCQLEHPKFMLKMLTAREEQITAKVLNENITHNIYGEEVFEIEVGIYNNDVLLCKDYGECQLSAEKNACRQLLKANYEDVLKKAMFPVDYKAFKADDQVNFGLLIEGRRVVEIEKGEDGFGFLIKGGEMRSKENDDFIKYSYYYPPFVSGIINNGQAERCGDLKAGDVLFSINDKNTDGMSHQSVVNLLKSVKGKVRLVVEYNKKVLIRDEIERRFSKFKERKLLSQITHPEWSKWHRSNMKKNTDDYKDIFDKKQV